MKRFLLTSMALLLGWVAPAGLVRGQVPPLENDLQVERSRISTERVTRQVEIIRLERMIERLQERVAQLERQAQGAQPFPAMTTIEAEAVLRVAQLQLDESERLHEQGEISELQLERDRLAVIRAKAQQRISETARADRALALEINVTQAERQLAEQTQKLRQLERLVARGYSSTEALQLQKLEVDQAQTELDRSRLRLELQKQLAEP